MREGDKAEKQTAEGATPPLSLLAGLVADILSAFGLLSRLPLPQARRHRAASAWSWPLVGLVIGGMATAVAVAADLAGLPLGAAAALYLATGMMATGALHEDGLADTCDGLFGGWTRERRLEIMKDSHIGSYGTLGLIVSQLALWSLVGQALSEDLWAVLVAGPVLSRAPMAVLMAALPNARGSGLSQGVGRPGWQPALIGSALAIALALGVTQAPLKVAVATLAVALVVAVLGAEARRRIGGQTGDILGASQQLALITALAVLQM